MDRVSQIPFTLLMEDPVFRKWMRKVPPKEVWATDKPPWRVYVQESLGGRWRRKDFESYVKAYNWVIRRKDEFWDMALTHKLKQFPPPVVKKKSSGLKHYWPGVERHSWCGFCRRPTVFKHFSKHHAIPQYYIQEDYRYCSTCGARDKFVNAYHTTLRPSILWGPPTRKELESSTLRELLRK